VADGIRRTLEMIPAAQVHISPDCGLKTRTIEETVGKLRVMVEAARLVRNELTVPFPRPSFPGPGSPFPVL
jgi:5-methyltetrahydropteroyltriglutamate--homocysteine methyltransferase